MKPLIFEAVLIGFKEGFKVGVVWLFFYSYLLLNERRALIRPFYAGLLFVSVISAAFLFLSPGPAVKEYLNNFIEMSFAFFLLSSAAALYHESGTNASRPFKELACPSALLNAGVFLLTLLFLLPDSMGSVLFLKELSFMKGAGLMTYISALAGGMVVFSLLFIIVRVYKPYWLGSFFDFPQMLLFLALAKLLGGGIKGFTEITLIPSVQRGIMKFFHDFIHQTFVLLMVPDHPLLRTTVWNFIGIFFGPNLAIAASLLLLLFFPLMFIYFSLIRKTPELQAGSGAKRRKIKAVLLSDRRRKSVPVFIFICLIIVTWFSGRGESVSRLYNPAPKPVVEDKGIVLIPLNDPTMDLMDGLLHKFSLAYRGQEIRLVIIRKSANKLSVCLDACEICPPDGYGQREDMVVCIYCNTPIPIKTLGEAGGCNPIPLTSVIDDRFVRIQLDEILKKWEYVKTGRGKEAVR